MMLKDQNTKERILEIAEHLIMSQGYNGFSYKDISSELNVKNAAIHYHYPSKKDLGVAVIQRAKDQFKAWVQFTSDQKVPLAEVLDQFFGIYVHLMESGKNICLGGSLETDFHTLPEEMQQDTKAYLTEMFQWMKRMLSKGREQGVFSFSGHPGDKALLVFSSLQGAIQMVRASDETTLHRVIKQIRRELGM
jgi:TetR/AcrR family transcriptional repressor of nem operon